MFYNIDSLRGSSQQKWQFLINFLLFPQKVFRCRGITYQISRGLAALEPPPKMGGEGGGFVFFVFNRKRKR